MEKVSQPIDRPSLLPGTDSVTALKRAACCAPAPRPPMICQMKRGTTVVEAAIASWEPALSASDIQSSERAPKRSMRTPDGSESSAAASVATEKSAPTSNLLAPRPCA